MKNIWVSVLMCLFMAGSAYAGEATKMKDTFSVIHSRKSVRTFTGAEVTRGNLEQILKAGMAAPTAVNMQPWYEKVKEFAIIDASLAGENILLAIEALGLGGVWTAAYPYEDRMKHVRTTLGIPREVIPLNVIAIGVPAAGGEKPKDKFKKDKIHWEKW
jgi:nitroreductase